MTIISPRSLRSSTTARPPRRQYVVDHLAGLAARLGEREPDDLPAGALRRMLADQRVVGVEHGEAVARDGLDDDRLDLGQLLEGVDAAQARGGRRRRSARRRRRCGR
jgi:hypothetical protein